MRLICPRSVHQLSAMGVIRPRGESDPTLADTGDITVNSHSVRVTSEPVLLPGLPTIRRECGNIASYQRFCVSRKTVAFQRLRK